MELSSSGSHLKLSLFEVFNDTCRVEVEGQDEVDEVV